MKLAEALIARKNSVARIAELKERFDRAAVHEEGEEPEEDAAALLESLKAQFEQHYELIRDINKTNNATMVTTSRSGSNTTTLMEAIAWRDVLKFRHGYYSRMAQEIRNRNESARYGLRALEKPAKKVLSAGVSLTDINDIVNSTAAELRSLDAAIQAAGWSTELL